MKHPSTRCRSSCGWSGIPRLPGPMRLRERPAPCCGFSTIRVLLIPMASGPSPCRRGPMGGSAKWCGGRGGLAGSGLRRFRGSRYAGVGGDPCLPASASRRMAARPGQIAGGRNRARGPGTAAGGSGGHTRIVGQPRPPDDRGKGDGPGRPRRATSLDAPRRKRPLRLARPRLQPSRTASTSGTLARPGNQRPPGRPGRRFHRSRPRLLHGSRRPPRPTTARKVRRTAGGDSPHVPKD